MADWAKIGKGALIGLGTVLSIIPAVGPLVGGGLIAAGVSINTGAKSTDPVNNAATALGTALSAASAYTAVSQPGGAAINTNGMMLWFQTNWKIVAGLIAAIIFLPMLIRNIGKK